MEGEYGKVSLDRSEAKKGCKCLPFRGGGWIGRRAGARELCFSFQIFFIT